MPQKESTNQKIEKLIKDDSLATLIFLTAIVSLKERIDNMSHQEVLNLFQGLVNPVKIRYAMEHIYDTITVEQESVN